ncbi:MAG: SDR family oxidoreductase [Acidobacteria bacterium]|nr:SDR family oxidoreductase [Acidobacteriota bacterium]
MSEARSAAAPFRENVVLLTGATAGIGREMALQLADQGAWLALGARNGGVLAGVVEECRRRGARCIGLPTDVGQERQCAALVEAALAEYGRLETLINNAGISMWCRFDEMESLEPLTKIMQVNYFGSVYCTHHALPHLKVSRGRIVGVSSLTGKTGVPTRSGYAASKHAIAGFFDSLRIELMGSGVTVTMAYPDFVATEVRQRAFGADGRPLGESPVKEGEVMSASECARQILDAAARRKREIVQSRRGRLGQWLKAFAPGLVDRIALRAIERGK